MMRHLQLLPCTTYVESRAVYRSTATVEYPRRGHVTLVELIKYRRY